MKEVKITYQKTVFIYRRKIKLLALKKFIYLNNKCKFHFVMKSKLDKRNLIKLYFLEMLLKSKKANFSIKIA